MCVEQYGYTTTYVSSFLRLRRYITILMICGITNYNNNRKATCQHGIYTVI